MTEQEVKELLFEITEYFRAEENGSVEPEQLLKANTLILYKDLYIHICNKCTINIAFSIYNIISQYKINNYFIADNFKDKDSVLIYKNFIITNELDADDNFGWAIIYYIDNRAIQADGKLLENIICEKQIRAIDCRALQKFKVDCDLVIQNPMAIIDTAVFMHNKHLHDIKIQANLEYIGDAAFAESSLSSIQIDNCHQISKQAFYNCAKLKKCQFPTNLSAIYDQAFEGCKNLNQINLENTQITAIPDRLFYGCQSLTSITIPNSVLSISKSAFEGCTNLSVISFSNFDHVVAINICNCSLPNNLSIVVPADLIDQWHEIEKTETADNETFSIDHLTCNA